MRALGRQPLSLSGSGVVLWSRHSLMAQRAASLRTADAIDAKLKAEREQVIEPEPGQQLSDLVACRVEPFPN